MGRIRICQLLTELRPAGAERCVYELARGLDPARFDVRVAALRGGAVEQWLDGVGVPVHVLGVRGKWDIAKLRSLADLLQREHVDLLHTHLFHADLAGRAAAYLAGTPHLVHTVHTAEWRFRPWQFFYARILNAMCDRIVCVSPAVLEHHHRRSSVPRRKYVVIPNGVDPSAFAPDAERRARLRGQWGAEPDEVLLAFAGRLDRQKGVDVLLAALSHLAARGRPRRIVIAGDGPMRPMVENYMAHGMGGECVRWVGFFDDVPGLLDAADVLVMPSRFGEGFGLTAAEAMAAGAAVVASSASGLATTVEHGVSGLLVPPGDSAALADAVQRVCTDAMLRGGLAEGGRGRVRSHYHISRFIEAHEHLYDQVAAGC